MVLNREKLPCKWIIVSQGLRMIGTLDLYKELKATNLTEDQAHAIVRCMQLCMEEGVQDLVTKHEFQMGVNALGARIDGLDAKITTLESKIETKIEASRADTLKWMVTFLVGGVTIGLGGVYFMLSFFQKHG